MSNKKKRKKNAVVGNILISSHMQRVKPDTFLIENPYEPDEIENRKRLEEARSLKPHRGKHRTPENKYR